MGGAYIGTPAVSNGVVFVASQNGPMVEARNASDGALLQTYSVPSAFFISHTAPTVTSAFVVVPNSGDTRIFGRYDGSLLQTIPLAGEVAISDDAVIISGNDRVASYAGPLDITFTPSGGTFTNPTDVNLTAANATASLRYTTDGSAPTLSSPSVANGAQVRMEHTGKLSAISVNGSTISRIFEASYTVNSEPLAAMSQAAPLAVPTADSDHDGQSDLAEAVAGTDPRNPSDVFRVATFTNSGSVIRITWPSKTARNYRVQCSTDLQNWSDITGPLPGTGATLSHEFPRPSGEACFLRVRIE